MLRFNHINIRTSKVAQTIDFYGKILNTKLGNRPSFPFPGAWLYSGSDPIIHIVETDNNASRPEMNTSLHHVAFEGENADEMILKLEKSNISYHKAVVPDSKEIQIFIKDPNGITIEIIFYNKGVDV